MHPIRDRAPATLPFFIGRGHLSRGIDANLRAAESVTQQVSGSLQARRTRKRRRRYTWAVEAKAKPTPHGGCAASASGQVKWSSHSKLDASTWMPRRSVTGREACWSTIAAKVRRATAMCRTCVQSQSVEDQRGSLRADAKAAFAGGHPLNQRFDFRDGPGSHVLIMLTSGVWVIARAAHARGRAYSPDAAARRQRAIRRPANRKKRPLAALVERPAAGRNAASASPISGAFFASWDGRKREIEEERPPTSALASERYRRNSRVRRRAPNTTAQPPLSSSNEPLGEPRYSEEERGADPDQWGSQISVKSRTGICARFRAGDAEGQNGETGGAKQEAGRACNCPNAAQVEIPKMFLAPNSQTVGHDQVIIDDAVYRVGGNRDCTKIPDQLANFSWRRPQTTSPIARDDRSRAPPLATII